jgi:ubiquinone/menaquinone biosynthesis C-methylase UbiE
MNLLNRNITLLVNFVLDNLLPPIFRDCKYIMYPLMNIAYGREAKLLLEFKEKFPFMNDAELTEYYHRIVNVPVNTRRETDLNRTCLNWIIKNIENVKGSVLDAACGRGFLLSKIIESNHDVQCYGIDIVLPQEIHSFCDDWVVVSRGGMQYKIQTADIMNLPFQDNSFDIVLCTHALEHIRDPQKALKELIRISRQRLIIVVPKQREYKYTIDFHVNFFPYLYSFKRFIGIENAVYLDLKGDFLCCIDL